jgi:hypothetical protein
MRFQTRTSPPWPARVPTARRSVLAAAVLLAFALTLPALARADVAVTIAAPTGPLVHALPNDLRIAEAQPSFLIAGSQAGSLRCDLQSAFAGDGFTYTACGPPAPGCAAAACETYTPPPLTSAPYTLSVELESEDAEGDKETATSFLQFDVDLSAPDTELEAEGHERPYYAGPPKPWSIGFTVADDDPLARSDSVRCSFGKAEDPPVWQTCASGVGPREGGVFKGPPLPNRHQDYRFEAQAIDDFGRPDPTPATFEFDPVPCLVQKVAPTSIGGLIAKGLPVTISCSLAGPEEAIEVYFLGKGGGHVLSPRKAIAVEERPPVARLAIRRPTLNFTRHLVVPLASVFKPSFRGQRDDVLWVTVGEAGVYEPYFSGKEIHVRG